MPCLKRRVQEFDVRWYGLGALVLGSCVRISDLGSGRAHQKLGIVQGFWIWEKGEGAQFRVLGVWVRADRELTCFRVSVPRNVN